MKYYLKEILFKRNKDILKCLIEYEINDTKWNDKSIENYNGKWVIKLNNIYIRLLFYIFGLIKNK